MGFWIGKHQWQRRCVEMQQKVIWKASIVFLGLFLRPLGIRAIYPHNWLALLFTGLDKASVYAAIWSRGFYAGVIAATGATMAAVDYRTKLLLEIKFLLSSLGQQAFVLHGLGSILVTERSPLWLMQGDVQLALLLCLVYDAHIIVRLDKQEGGRGSATSIL